MLHEGDTVIVFAATTEVKLHMGVTAMLPTTGPVKVHRVELRHASLDEIRKVEVFTALHAKILVLGRPILVLEMGGQPFTPAKLPVPKKMRSRCPFDNRAAGVHGAVDEFAKKKKPVVLTA